MSTTEPLSPPPSSDNPVPLLLGDHHHHHHVHGPAPSESSALAKDDDGSHPPHHHQIEHANLEHFNSLGADFDKQHPESAEFADRLLPALNRLVRLDEETTSVLDYACGSGQVSRVLAPYVAQLVGVDISPRMVEVYNARANAQGLEPHEMRAINSLDQLLDSQSQPQLFDIAVVRQKKHIPQFFFFFDHLRLFISARWLIITFLRFKS
jgi:SAM-dependent methyltransferase